MCVSSSWDEKNQVYSPNTGHICIFPSGAWDADLNRWWILKRRSKITLSSDMRTSHYEQISIQMGRSFFFKGTFKKDPVTQQCHKTRNGFEEGFTTFGESYWSLRLEEKFLSRRLYILNFLLNITLSSGLPIILFLQLTMRPSNVQLHQRLEICTNQWFISGLHFFRHRRRSSNIRLQCKYYFNKDRNFSGLTKGLLDVSRIFNSRTKWSRNFTTLLKYFWVESSIGAILSPHARPEL